VRPSQTADNPRIKCNPIFAKERKSLPSFIKLTVSFPNVENVVKAPNNPIKMNERASEEKIPLDSANCVNIPISRQPIRFTVRIPKGNVRLLDQFWIYPLTP